MNNCIRCSQYRPGTLILTKLKGGYFALLCIDCKNAWTEYIRKEGDLLGLEIANSDIETHIKFGNMTTIADTIELKHSYLKKLFYKGKKFVEEYKNSKAKIEAVK